MTVTERGTDLLTVLVPEGVLTGDVAVTKDALVSNGISSNNRRYRNTALPKGIAADITLQLHNFLGFEKS
jgi:hypothetical protein